MNYCKLLLILSLPFVSTAFATEYGKVSSQKINDHVYLFTTTPYGVGLSGNSTAIIGDESVLIFDSNGLPKTAETILTEVRKLTNKPVRYLINSHWHWDHWAGNQVYQAAFPDLQIITHEKTLEQMLTVEPKWNDAGLKSGLPGYLNELKAKLQKEQAENKPASETKALEELIHAGKEFLEAKTSLRKTYPNVTFSDSMTLRMGDEQPNIRHARAITAGDTYMYLPKEKILITGDILLSPYPYAIGGTYPTDWLNTLKGFVELQPSIIIPGHGKPQTIEFLQQNVDLFQTILQQVKDAKSRGLTAEQTGESVGKESKELASKIGIVDEQVAAEFKAYFLDVFVARAYRELEGPLGDLPDGLPE